MPREDYEAISKIVEDVVGKDTLNCIKILEGIKFYFENKVEKVRIVKSETPVTFKVSKIHEYKKDADRAMKRYTDNLRKESAKFRNKKQNCSTSS